MDNKVLVKIILPEINQNYDIFIPVNEIVWKIKKLLVKALSDLSCIDLNNKEYLLINKDNGKIYNENEIIIDTDIRNTTELFLISVNKYGGIYG